MVFPWNHRSAICSFGIDSKIPCFKMQFAPGFPHNSFSSFSNPNKRFHSLSSLFPSFPRGRLRPPTFRGRREEKRQHPDKLGDLILSSFPFSFLFPPPSYYIARTNAAGKRKQEQTETIISRKKKTKIQCKSSTHF